MEPPADVDPRDLDHEIRSQLRTLSKLVADRVARHLVAAGRLVDEDPEAALVQARAARALGARVAVVRQAVGETAYAAGEWAEAIAELRTARRMTGDDSALPLLADAERALGRPDRALRLAQSPEAQALPPAERAELRIVEAGARRDLGQLDAALVTLQGSGLDRRTVESWSARLWYAYADLLLALGRADEAREWFAAAASADQDGSTDADERILELDGIVVLEDDEDDEDLPDGGTPSAEAGGVVQPADDEPTVAVGGAGEEDQLDSYAAPARTEESGGVQPEVHGAPASAEAAVVQPADGEPRVAVDGADEEGRLDSSSAPVRSVESGGVRPEVHAAPAASAEAAVVGPADGEPRVAVGGAGEEDQPEAYEAPAHSGESGVGVQPAVHASPAAFSEAAGGVVEAAGDEAAGGGEQVDVHEAAAAQDGRSGVVGDGGPARSDGVATDAGAPSDQRDVGAESAGDDAGEPGGGPAAALRFSNVQPGEEAVPDRPPAIGPAFSDGAAQPPDQSGSSA